MLVPIRSVGPGLVEGMTTQGVLALGLPPVPNETGLFWCCGDCFPVTGGLVSFSWQPPDYKTGHCYDCGRSYQFRSAYGKDELQEVLDGKAA